MMNSGSEKLVEKLTRGISKSLEIIHSVYPEAWDQPIYGTVDSWNLKDLVAHFIYSEENLLAVAQDISLGGEGAPSGIDIDDFNQEETDKLKHLAIDELMAKLAAVRELTIEWVRLLDDSTLEMVGRHPVLEETNVETVIFSIYAHQLLHMRESAPKLRKSSRA